MTTVSGFGRFENSKRKPRKRPFSGDCIFSFKIYSILPEFCFVMQFCLKPKCTCFVVRSACATNSQQNFFFRPAWQRRMGRVGD